MPSYNSLQELMNEVKKKAEVTLRDEVLKTVQVIEHKHVIQDVYSKYSPTTYQRRRDVGDNGSLSNINNIQVTEIQSGESNVSVSINNITKPAGSDGVQSLEGLVNYGDGGDMYGDTYAFPLKNRDKEKYTYLKPRRFIDNTREELRSSDDVKRAVLRGLKNRGINSK